MDTHRAETDKFISTIIPCPLFTPNDKSDNIFSLLQIVKGPKQESTFYFLLDQITLEQTTTHE